jgi:LPPG:FO 2-phospho-L-lactate transferase
LKVVCLAGGTGGAKLARGLLGACDELTVVANTADDVEVYGAHVSPDPDLVLFRLADRLDERGWGLLGDTFHAMDELRALGEDVWFELGDRDLAIGLHRARRLGEGARLTEALAELAAALGVAARVLPMCDEPVRTRVNGAPFQRWMIRHRGEPVRDVVLHGIAGARPAPEVRDAVAAADVVVIGPSNPVISVGPILAVPGLRALLAEARAPVVMVSPLVDGAVLKGPTAAFLRWAGVERTAAGVAAYYGAVLDGVVADEPVPGLPCLVTDTAMADRAAQERVAREVLAFAADLPPR